MSLEPSFAGDCVRGLGAIVFWAAVGWSSYLVAFRLAPAASAAVRWCTAAVAGAWLLLAGFWLLVPASLFRIGVALPLFAALAVALHLWLGRRRDPLGHLSDDVAATLHGLGGLLGRPAGWMLVAVLAVVFVRCLRGSVTPPLGWDSLTYHLYKAGRWVQTGGLAAQPAPDSWSFYEYFPVVGEVLWTWAMLPLHTDALLTVAGTAIWGLCLLGLYALGRELGGSREAAVLVATAVAAMPVLLAYLSSGYVDNTTLAFFLLGALFTVRVWRHRSLLESPLALGAFSLMLGTKLTTAAFFALGGLLIIAGVLRSQAPVRRRRLVLLACLGAAAIGYPGYQRAWVERGSPFFPFHIAFGGVVLSQGVPSAAAALADLEAVKGLRLGSPAAFWEYFLFQPKVSGSFVNPGPGLVLLVVPALLGAAAALRDPRRRVPAAFLLACALVMLGGFLSGNMVLFRTTTKVTTAGRYVTIGIAALAVLGVVWRHRIAKAFWIAAVVGGLALSAPRVWVPAEARPMLEGGALALGAALGLAACAVVWRRSGRRLGPAVAAVLLVAGGVAGLEQVRAPARYALYAAAADRIDPLFHMHRIEPSYASAWVLWQALDAPARPHVIAATAGWDGIGHNWYRYPLLGRRLQNRVLYVPVTADGSVIDYRLRERLAHRASLDAWLRRLVDRRVDVVVSLAPRSTIEDFWMRKLPELFRPMAADPEDLNVAYRFDRRKAAELLAAGEVPAPSTS
jgi:hypothetical protein